MISHYVRLLLGHQYCLLLSVCVCVWVLALRGVPPDSPRCPDRGALGLNLEPLAGNPSLQEHVCSSLRSPLLILIYLFTLFLFTYSTPAQRTALGDVGQRLPLPRRVSSSEARLLQFTKPHIASSCAWNLADELIRPRLLEYSTTPRVTSSHD